MEINELMKIVNNYIHIHDSTINIEFLSKNGKNYTMAVNILDLDKFLGLEEIATLINKCISKYGLHLNYLYLK